MNVSDEPIEEQGGMSFQQVIIVGRAGDDPKETPFSNSNLKAVNISVAVSESWTDKQTNERKEKTVWFRCLVTGRAAEIALMYVKKGSQVMLIGTIDAPRPYTDKNGQPAASLELRVRELRLLGSKNDNQSSTNEYSYDDGGSTYNSAPRDVDDIPF
jgi:single-strand DNA-binding protein